MAVYVAALRKGLKESFGGALLTLFRCLTGESYNGILHDTMVTEAASAPGACSDAEGQPRVGDAFQAWLPEWTPTAEPRERAEPPGPTVPWALDQRALRRSASRPTRSSTARQT